MRSGVILEDIASILESSGKNAAELGKLFNRERKCIYNMKNAASFRMDYDILHGLAKLGYCLKLVDIKTGEIFNP